jgi:lipopolysaccharide biosynthesis glycosyltransferase
MRFAGARSFWPSPAAPPNDRLRMKMEILCGCDERFLPHAATMLCSLLEHNRVSRVHLFHNSDFSGNLAALARFVAKYDAEAVFYEISAERLQGFRVDKHASLATYYRLMAPRILPGSLKKILYLDSDIIVRHSLRDLWNMDLGGCPLAAVEEPLWDPTREEYAKFHSLKLPSGAKYFNAGVLLINLDYWRRYNVHENAVAFIREFPEQVNYWDQDALNAVLVSRWIALPATWNAVHQHISGVTRVPDPAIVHFSGPVKPWDWEWLEVEHPFKFEYHRYRRKTPWRYRLRECRPGLASRLYQVARVLCRPGRVLLPGRLRQWLRSRMATPTPEAEEEPPLPQLRSTSKL